MNKFLKLKYFMGIGLIFLIGISLFFNMGRKEEINYFNDIIFDYRQDLIKQDYTSAEEKFKEIMKDEKLFESLSKDNKFVLFNSLGVVKMHQGEMIKAVLLFEDALNYSNGIDKKSIITNLAITYRYLGEHFQSSEMLMGIVNSNMYDKENTALIKGYALLNLAENFYQIGNIDKVREILKEVEEYIDDFPLVDKYSLEIIYRTYRVILNLVDDDLEAVKENYESIEMLKDERNHLNMENNRGNEHKLIPIYTEEDLYIYRNYALYYDKINDLESAAIYYRKLEKEALKLNDFLNLDLAIYRQIEISEQLDNKEEYTRLVEMFYEREKANKKLLMEQYQVILTEKIQLAGDSSIEKIVIVMLLSTTLVAIVTVCIINEKAKKAKKQSLKDALCGVYNRRYLDAYLKSVDKSKTSFSILMLDVDYFKLYNDYYGHQQGDEVLKSVANSLKSSCRSTDIVARYGGEEFCIILENTVKEQAIACADKIITNINAKNISHEKSEVASHVTISIGIHADCKVGRIDENMKLADEALYKAKNNGRNRYECL